MSEQKATPQAESNPMSDVAKQIAALTVEASDIDQLNAEPGLEPDIDVPVSTFWGESSVAKNEAPEEVSLDVPENTQIITFKANGKDYELSPEDAGKKLGISADLVKSLPAEAIKSALSKIEGGTHAFNKLAQANKKVKELESSIPELRKKAELLDKLDNVKDDWRSLLQIITGQDPEQFLEDAIRKQKILKSGSETEIRQLEREERLAQLEKKLAAQDEKQKALEDQEKDRSYRSEKENLKSMLETEFFKHKLTMENEIDSNDANELLWQQGQQRMKQYVKKYQDHPKFQELLPKMAQKSFEDVSGKLKRLTTGSVQSEVEKAIKAKKAKAAEQAAVSSTRRISNVNVDDFKGLGIREIADKLVGKKKFTF